MKFLKGALIFIAIVAIIVVVSMMLLPSAVTVERNKVIDAPIADVYNQVADLKNWENWNPWLEKDPNVEYDYAANTMGKDAWYTWKSEVDEVGSGKLTILEAEKEASLKTLLEFEGMDPGNGRWVFEAQGEQTKVTWALDSEFSGFDKLFGPLLDGMVGPDFEKGLGNIEKAAQDYPAWTPTKKRSPGHNYIYTRLESNMKDLDAVMIGGEYGKLMGYAMSEGMELAGAPMAIYEKYDEQSGDMTVRFAIPLTAAAEEVPEGMMTDKMQMGNTLVATHVGPYDEVGPAWEKIKKYIEQNGVAVKGFPYEVYVNDPEEVKDPAKYITEVTFPV